MEDLEFKELDFENIVIDKENNRAVNMETGEILDKDSKSKVIDIVEERRKKDKILDAKEKELEKMVGIEEKRQFNWKSGKKVQFIKIYRTEMREYSQTIKISPGGGLLLFYIQNYIEYETNRIAKPDKSSFTNKELEELTGLSIRVLKYTLDELEELLIISRVGKGRAREIYFNPYLACSGNEILKTTIKLFEKYDPITSY